MYADKDDENGGMGENILSVYEANLGFEVVIHEAKPASESFVADLAGKMSYSFGPQGKLGELVKGLIDSGPSASRSLDFELHLDALNILLWANLGILTKESAQVAGMIDKLWKEGKAKKDYKGDNLFYEFLYNYTWIGSQSAYESIANRLLDKVDCWDSQIEGNDTERRLKRNCYREICDTDFFTLVRQFNEKSDLGYKFIRKGWSWQTEPKGDGDNGIL